MQSFSYKIDRKQRNISFSYKIVRVTFKETNWCIKQVVPLAVKIAIFGSLVPYLTPKISESSTAMPQTALARLDRGQKTKKTNNPPPPQKKPQADIYI